MDSFLDTFEEKNSASPSFIENSCPGENCLSKTEGNGAKTSLIYKECMPRPTKSRSGGVGGYTCCVPGCYNNSKKQRNVSFHTFPNGKSSEKKLLRKKWINLISRKDFVPTSGHRVCSEHFKGGKKTYLNNVPIRTPKTTNMPPVRPRKTQRARNRQEPVINDVQSSSPADNATDFAPQQDAGISNVVAQTRAVDHDTNEQLKTQIACLLEENQILRAQQNASTTGNLEENYKELNLEKIKGNNKIFKFYTGLQDYATFQALLRFFGPVVNNLVYHDSGANHEKIADAKYKKRGPKRCLTAEHEFFLVLVRLRLGLLEEDLAYRFHLSQSHISRICITWFDFLHSYFRMLPIWPSRSCIDDTMPKCFREIYPTTRVIVDCTELFLEMPSSVRSQSVTFSNYKHHNTAKGLIGIAPSGAVTFVSDLYAGRSSDKQITMECGILDILEEGDTIMADKGFDIACDLPQGVKLNIPPFLRSNKFLSVDDERATRKIASLRIHVERAIRRLKTFRILSTVFPLSMAPEMNKIWVICGHLTNFMSPLIADVD